VIEQVRRAAELLRAGELVAFPTETVYGLGADAENERAIRRLYEIKGRPAAHPVIVHFADVDSAFRWARDVPAAARRLAESFWPGPLTLVLTRADRAKDFVTGGQESIGVRVPSHPVAQALLRAFGGAVAAPSANRHGAVSPTRVEHVIADFGDSIPLVLEGGESEVGIESTIVQATAESMVLLRPGRISEAEIEQRCGVRVIAKRADSPRHSGGESRHYSPETPAWLVKSADLEEALSSAASRGTVAAVLVLSGEDRAAAYRRRLPPDPEQYAQKLYAALRELDRSGATQILIEAPPATAAWAAVNDRLQRATRPWRA
jgi:L-threonylcarbamoyladenylate synthase